MENKEVLDTKIVLLKDKKLTLRGGQRQKGDVILLTKAEADIFIHHKAARVWKKLDGEPVKTEEKVTT